jgi:hypothetical protein
MKTLFALTAAALLAGPAIAAPVPVHDRIADLCSVSSTDLEGQRLARACRAQVRAAHAAERRLVAEQRPIRVADATTDRPR